jgi:hypothetical protein
MQNRNNRTCYCAARRGHCHVQGKYSPQTRNHTTPSGPLPLEAI